MKKVITAYVRGATDESAPFELEKAFAEVESKVRGEKIKAGIARKKELVEAKKDTEPKPAVNPQAPVWTKADPWRVREVRRREREKRAQRRAR